MLSGNEMYSQVMSSSEDILGVNLKRKYREIVYFLATVDRGSKFFVGVATYDLRARVIIGEIAVSGGEVYPAESMILPYFR
jgi:hypothetical protein